MSSGACNYIPLRLETENCRFWATSGSSGQPWNIIKLNFLPETDLMGLFVGNFLQRQDNKTQKYSTMQLLLPKW